MTTLVSEQNRPIGPQLASLIYSYPIPELQEEVYKRTSVLGANRFIGDDMENHLLDRLSFTEGEYFLFSEALEEATAETYEWLKAFGRNVLRAYQVSSNPVTVQVWENLGLCMTLDNVLKDFHEATKIPATPGISVTTPLYIAFYFNKPIVCKSYADLTATFIAKAYGVTNGEADELIGTRTMTRTISAGSTERIQGTDNFPLVHRYDKYYVTIELASVAPANQVSDIAAGSFVEYNYYTSGTEYKSEVYEVIRDCTLDNWVKCVDALQVDPRNKVVFCLDLPHNFDPNMMRPIERHIKEALVCFIIYRWLDYTKADEADKWYERYEKHAQEAQLGLNSEMHISERPYKWY